MYPNPLCTYQNFSYSADLQFKVRGRLLRFSSRHYQLPVCVTRLSDGLRGCGLCVVLPLKAEAARVNVSRPGTGAERSDATLVSSHTPESRYPEWRDLRSWRQRAPPCATSCTVAENPPRDSGPLAPLPAASRFWQQRAYEYNHNATGSWCLHRRPPTWRRHTTSHCLYDPMLGSGHPFSTTACGTKPFKRDPIYPTP